MLQPQFAKVQYGLIPLAGGLDQVTPTLSLKPGVARDSLNFECSITGGYSRIAGYERFDGRFSPSEASYSQITAMLSAPVAVGNTIVGATSAATGVVIAVDGGQIAFTKATGTFTVGETIQVAGVDKGTVAAMGSMATSLERIAQYGALAADVYRADIGPVPGSGPVRGVAYFKGEAYAWRNNAGGTELVLHKASTSGWAVVSLGQELAFSNGSVALAEGNIVTGSVSGATGTIARVVVQSGTWGAGTAAGRLILSESTGTFSASAARRSSRDCSRQLRRIDKALWRRWREPGFRVRRHGVRAHRHGDAV